jgi:hypothetical protein
MVATDLRLVGEEVFEACWGGGVDRRWRRQRQRRLLAGGVTLPQAAQSNLVLPWLAGGEEDNLRRTEPESEEDLGSMRQSGEDDLVCVMSTGLSVCLVHICVVSSGKSVLPLLSSGVFLTV